MDVWCNGDGKLPARDPMDHADFPYMARVQIIGCSNVFQVKYKGRMVKQTPVMLVHKGTHFIIKIKTYIGYCSTADF